MGVGIGELASRRMHTAGITKGQVEYVIGHSEESYLTHGDQVHKAHLPDGRLVKVRTRKERHIVDVIVVYDAQQEVKECLSSRWTKC